MNKTYMYYCKVHSRDIYDKTKINTPVFFSRSPIPKKYINLNRIVFCFKYNKLLHGRLQVMVIKYTVIIERLKFCFVFLREEILQLSGKYGALNLALVSSTPFCIIFISFYLYSGYLFFICHIVARYI